MKSIATWLFAFLLLVPLSLPAQSLQIQVANLQNDIDRLDQIVRALRLEVEALSRENKDLRQWALRRAEVDQSNYVTLSQLNSTLKSFETQVNSATQASQKALIKEVSKEIESLAKQTQSAINALAKSIDGQPTIEQVITFNDNYPKAGITYTVKGGDSLAKIARQNNSSVDWIKNANRLSSDIIYPGQELFIPQKN